MFKNELKIQRITQPEAADNRRLDVFRDLPKEIFDEIHAELENFKNFEEPLTTAERQIALYLLGFLTKGSQSYATRESVMRTAVMYLDESLLVRNPISSLPAYLKAVALLRLDGITIPGDPPPLLIEKLKALVRDAIQRTHWSYLANYYLYFKFAFPNVPFPAEETQVRDCIVFGLQGVHWLAVAKRDSLDINEMLACLNMMPEGKEFLGTMSRGQWEGIFHMMREYFKAHDLIGLPGIGFLRIALAEAVTIDEHGVHIVDHVATKNSMVPLPRPRKL